MNLTETKDAIAHHGERQTIAGERAMKDGNHEEGRRCADRAECAHDEGRVLHGDQEARSPNYLDDHDKLIKGAQEHDLMKYDFKEPPEV